jgi:hypothetical protein
VKKLSLLILLILINWIPLLGQIGKDTVKCYNASELRLIATGLIKAKECQYELSLCEKEVGILNNIVARQQIIIQNDSTIVATKDELLESKTIQLGLVDGQLAKEKQSHKWTKIKYGITTTVLVIFATYFMIH